MATETTIQQLAVRESTKLRLDDGWELGLQMVYEGSYTDTGGQTQAGLLARISVWDGISESAETLEIHQGAVFQAGKRYQVLEIGEDPSGDLPGTSGGYLVIGQLP